MTNKKLAVLPATELIGYSLVTMEGIGHSQILGGENGENWACGSCPTALLNRISPADAGRRFGTVVPTAFQCPQCGAYNELRPARH